MLVPRSIILLIMIILIFSPAIEQWVSNNQAAWYRPYIAWAMIIFLVFFNNFALDRNTKRDSE